MILPSDVFSVPELSPVLAHLLKMLRAACFPILLYCWTHWVNLAQQEVFKRFVSIVKNEELTLLMGSRSVTSLKKRKKVEENFSVSIIVLQVSGSDMGYRYSSVFPLCICSWVSLWWLGKCMQCQQFVWLLRVLLPLGVQLPWGSHQCRWLMHFVPHLASPSGLGKGFGQPWEVADALKQCFCFWIILLSP